jgi:hypothetical protein
MRMLLLLLLASPALAAPRIENLSVKPDSKTSEVEVALSVSKSGGNCDVRLDFGDGRGRTVDFGLATTRTLKYTYKAGGSYKVTAKGTGKAPCEGAKEAAIRVAGAPEKKAAEKKKAEPKKKAEAKKKAEPKKKAEKKKADKKSAPAKKEEPK